jgi:hypothetical protein
MLGSLGKPKWEYVGGDRSNERVVSIAIIPDPTPENPRPRQLTAMRQDLAIPEIDDWRARKEMSRVYFELHPTEPGRAVAVRPAVIVET